MLQPPGGRPVSVGRIKGDGDHHHRAQAVTHTYVVLTFFTSGSATFDVDVPWTVRAGDVLLIPAGMAHRRTATRASEAWALAFCPTCFLTEGSADLLEPFDRVRAGAGAVVTIPPARRAFLETMFQELAREVDADGPHGVQRSLLTLITAEVNRAADWNAMRRGDDLVGDALRYIERHCLEAISLQDVAKEVRRSSAHLTTVVRRATGRSVQEWIIAGRMNEARRRLAQTDELVEVIAERVGYADATHFIRLFRRSHGVTPAAWRAGDRAHFHEVAAPVEVRERPPKRARS